MFLIAGYAFCRVFPVFQKPLGGFLFTLTLFSVSAVWLRLRKVRFKKIPVIVVISAVIISLSLVLTSNGFLYFFAFSYALAAYSYFMYSMCCSGSAGDFNDYITVDFFKALFIVPFFSFVEIFRALFTGKARGSGKTILGLIIGICIALVPTVTVIALLSYDSGFVRMILDIFSFDITDIISHIVSIIFAVPFAMYFFGLYASSSQNKCDNILPEKKCAEYSGRLKIAPVSTVLAAVVPLLIVYVIFFISQWKYYISGFTGELPGGLSYADYARDGFFQLCTVAFINLIVMISIIIFMKRSSRVHAAVLKILSVTYSVFTLILISTAIAKMVMYINCYGLTQKRVYASWFMAVLAVIFIIMIVKQFVRCLNAAAASVMAAVIMFAALALPDVDSLIAKYNVDRYIDGKMSYVDVYSIFDLGDSGVPELVRLSENLKGKIENGDTSEITADMYESLEMYFREIRYDYRNERGIFSVTVPYVQAKNALESVS